MEKQLIWVVILLCYCLSWISWLLQSPAQWRPYLKLDWQTSFIPSETNGHHILGSRAKAPFASRLKWITRDIAICIISILFPIYRQCRRLLKIRQTSDPSAICSSSKLNVPLDIEFPSVPFNIDVYGLGDIFREIFFPTISDLPLMRYEWVRYETYKTYPFDGPSTPSKLAANGFYYICQGTNVRCFSCNVTNNIWPENETVAETHKRISPNCRFTNDNVPIHERSGDIEGNRDIYKYPDFANIEKRKLSFLGWPTESTMNGQFAAAGLFYTGRKDLVRCYSCGFGFFDWRADDDPWEEHKKYSPGCLHLQNTLESSSSPDNLPTESPVQQQASYRIQYPEYQEIESRLESFKTFPLGDEIAAMQMALAGLYFTGVGDSCRCFSCGGGLCDWKAEDDPCKEHAKNYADCTYINHLKGKYYIAALQDNIQNDTKEQQPSYRIQHPEYRNTEARIASFKTFPLRDRISAMQMAAAGLYFTGVGDACRCFSCGGGLHKWEAEDDPCKEHAKHYPDCTYINHLKGKYYLAALKNSTQNNTNEQQSSDRTRSSEYQEIAARLASFKTFPRRNQLSAVQLVVAGFYFTGVGDSCRCFTCGGGLKDWHAGDDPSREHARYFPNCDYINKLKGKDFIASVRDRRENDTDKNEGEQTEAEFSSTPETVTEDLNSSAAQLFISMGYTEAFVKAAVEDLKKTNGNTTLTVETLKKYVLDTEPNLVNATNTEDIVSRSTMNLLSPSNQHQETAERRNQELQEEIQRLEDKVLCKVCFQEEVCILFLPCGHHAICSTCKETGNFQKCVICRANVTATVRTYHP